ncbi:hypothetical protein MKEN_00310800 [Mycena kentingensis (nom. inval.)]|nr:hypothetical protein MKEN_00310800 [Mycena kentingensis (nom. inval.)]
MYMTIGNNPRGIRYLREETALLMVFPGPKEPTQEQYNNVMELVFERFAALYQGAEFEVHGKEEKAIVHVQIGTDVSDLPASRRTWGLLAVTSKWWMCDGCRCPFFALVHPDSFNPAKLDERDPWKYIKYSARARNASSDVAEEIAQRRGIRPTPAHRLPNLLPGETNLIDPMHSIFLGGHSQICCSPEFMSAGLVKHVRRNIILNNGLVSSAGIEKMEIFLESIVWPPSISRLPPSIARATGKIKADQWRTHSSIFFLALFVAWEEDGKIPDKSAPPIRSNTKLAATQKAQEKLVRSRLREYLPWKDPDATEAQLDAVDATVMNRSYRKHFDTLLMFTAAVRILTSNSISPNEVMRGCDMLETAIQSYARMHAHLVPYFHLVVDHLRKTFLRWGPAPGWWTFAYERNNGFLGRFNHNGHSGGELEGTMMRGFWKTVMIQDLIQRLERLPNPHPADVQSLAMLREKIRGGTSERRGTLENYLARAEAEKLRGKVHFPKGSTTCYLRPIQLYLHVLSHLKSTWRTVDLISDSEMEQTSRHFSFIDGVKSYSHVWLEKRRYGAATHARGRSARFAYLDHRMPVQIEYLFCVDRETAEGVRLSANLAVIRRFRKSTVITDFPWDLYAVDMGVAVWLADDFHKLEVVQLERLSGHFILAPIEWFFLHWDNY